MQKIRVFEAFAGYGSQLMALKRLQAAYPNEIEMEPIGISEIDPHAIKAYRAVHGDVTNYGDISKIDWSKVPNFDLFTYSSPCQDFSIAGKQIGGEEGSGTRSSLLWECRRAILAKKPKYLIMENVAALVQAKFIKLFNKWQLELESYGYKNFAKVLNAKNYGVPQSRERIFMVSILDENVRFEFPQPMPLTRKLKDVLEKNVDEKYYLSDERLQGLKISTQKEKDAGRGFTFKPKNENDEIANSVTTHSGGRKTDNFIKTVGNLYDNTNGGKAAGVVIDDRGGVFSTIRAGDNPKLIEYGEKNRVENTVTTAHHYSGNIVDPKRGQKEMGVLETQHNLPFRVRRLSERELFRLMDVSEEDIDKIQAAGISKTQQAKMAGNSIVVNVLYEIFRKMFVDTERETAQLELF